MRSCFQRTLQQKKKFVDFEDIIFRLYQALTSSKPVEWPNDAIVYTELSHPSACIDPPKNKLKAVVSLSGTFLSHLGIITRAQNTIHNGYRMVITRKP